MAGTAVALVPTAVRRALPARHVLSAADLDPATIVGLVEDALAIKHAPPAPALRGPLAGRAVCLLFQKPSLRTRVSFEVGLSRLGAAAVVLSGAEVGLGARESTEDIARTLERYVDAIVARVNDHRELVRLASAASVPVVNALSDREHPCQALADLVTLREHLGSLPGRVLAFVGDGNNVAHSLLLAGASVGLHVRVATPRGYEPDASIVADASALAATTGGSVSVGHDPRAAVAGSDAVYTDVWASMGQEDEATERRRVFAPYAVTPGLLRDAPRAKVLHCLPAHRGEEIAAEVIDGPASVVFDQAENRLHAQQALLLHLLTPSAPSVRTTPKRGATLRAPSFGQPPARRRRVAPPLADPDSPPLTDAH